MVTVQLPTQQPDDGHQSKSSLSLAVPSRTSSTHILDENVAATPISQATGTLLNSHPSGLLGAPSQVLAVPNTSSATSVRKSGTNLAQAQGSAKASSSDKPPASKPLEDDGWETDLEIPVQGRILDKTGQIAYMSACKQLGIVPVSYFVKNLAKDTIIMQHHGLGPRGAQAIAQCLINNTNVTHLDLTDNWLDQEGGAALGEMLNENVGIVHLNISDNRIGSLGGKSFAQMLEVNSSLQSLVLRGNKLGDQEVTEIANAMHVNDRLLHLDLSHNEMGEIGALALAKMVGGGNSILKSLDLSWNHLRGPGTLVFLESFKENSGIETLHMGWNGLSDAAAEKIGQALSVNTALKSLNLVNNRIGDQGIVAMTKFLELNKGLRELKLSGNIIGDTGLAALLKYAQLASSLTLLEVKGVKPNEEALTKIAELQTSKPNLKIIIS